MLCNGHELRGAKTGCQDFGTGQKRLRRSKSGKARSVSWTLSLKLGKPCSHAGAMSSPCHSCFAAFLAVSRACRNGRNGAIACLMKRPSCNNARHHCSRGQAKCKPCREPSFRAVWEVDAAWNGAIFGCFMIP